MTATTDLIAELVRAANSLERASLLERRQLLTRAISAIRDMRDVARAASSRTADDNLINLATITASMERRRESEVRAAFLSSAEMLRDLRIVIDAKVEVIIGQIRGVNPK